MIEILKYCLEGGFWHFVGCWFVLGLAAQSLIAIVKIVLK